MTRLRISCAGLQLAELSEDGLSRFLLWRCWGIAAGHALFCALNPSIADGLIDDQTISKEVGFCKRWGLVALRKVNTSPLISTDPARLTEPKDDARRAAEARNLTTIRSELTRHGLAMVVVAWGACEEAIAPGRVIVQMAIDAGHVPMCLGLTKDGHPRHPCRLGYATQLERFGGNP